MGPAASRRDEPYHPLTRKAWLEVWERGVDMRGTGVCPACGSGAPRSATEHAGCRFLDCYRCGLVVVNADGKPTVIRPVGQ